MTLNEIIKPILANGGWCKINSKNSDRMIDLILGRIIHSGKEHIVIQKYNLSADFLDGFVLIENKQIKKIEKGNFVKKLLSTGGKVIEKPSLPEYTKAESLSNLIQNIIEEKVKCQIRLNTNQDLFGRIKSNRDGKIEFEIQKNGKVCSQVIIELKQIQLLMTETHEIRKTVHNISCI